MAITSIVAIDTRDIDRAIERYVIRAPPQPLQTASFILLKYLTDTGHELGLRQKDDLSSPANTAVFTFPSPQRSDDLPNHRQLRPPHRDEGPGETASVSPGAGGFSKVKPRIFSGAERYIGNASVQAAFSFLAGDFFGPNLTISPVFATLPGAFLFEDFDSIGLKATSASDNKSGLFSRGIST